MALTTVYSTPVGRNLIGFYVGVKGAVLFAEISMKEVTTNNSDGMIVGGSFLLLIPA